MAFLGETILLPIHSPLPPNTFAFFKRIPETKYDENETDEPIREYIDKKIKVGVHGKKGYFIRKVVNFHAFKDNLKFSVFLPSDEDPTVDELFTVNSDDLIIMELDKVPGRVINPNLENIGDKEENELIEELRRDPSLTKKIPQVLWDRTNFQRKIVYANLPLEGKYVPQNVKTMARMRRNDSVANKTGILDTDLLPDGPLSNINEMLGLKAPPGLDKARLEKISRRKGGRKRTRRFKK